MTLHFAKKQGTLMGLTHITATVKPLNKGGEPVQAQFLVDTGAIDCLLPASMLNRAGLEPEETNIYELADGRLIELPVAAARIEFMGQCAIAKIIFGPEDSEPILGAIALEYAGFTVDPSNQTLKRLAVRSLKKLSHNLVPVTS